MVERSTSKGSNPSNPSLRDAAMNVVAKISRTDTPAPAKKFAQGHLTCVTSAGRLKLLHREDTAVMEAWHNESSSPAVQAPASLQCDVEAVNVSRHKPETAAEGSPPLVVEFFAPEVICSEDDSDRMVSVLVRRLGDLSSRLEVGYEIENGNIDPSCEEQLEPRFGKVVFEAGAMSAYAKLPVVHDSSWNIEAYYVARLLPDSLNGSDAGGKPPAIVGRNSAVAVRHLNIERFPNNVKVDATKFQLWVGFLLHNYSEIPLATRFGIVLAIYPAIESYLSAFVLKLLVDCGILPNHSCKGFFEWAEEMSPYASIYFLLGAHVFLFCVSHIRDFTFRRLRLGGKATKMLRANMFMQMMQISQEAREDYNQGDIPKTMDTVVEAAVRDCWLCSFALVTDIAETLLKGVLVIQVALSAKAVFTKVMIFSAAPLMILLTVICDRWFRKREIRLSHEATEASENWFACVSMAESCSSIIKGYRQADVAAMSVDKLHGHINEYKSAGSDVTAFSVWLLRWGFTIIQVVALGVAGVATQNETLLVGEFIVLHQTISSFGTTLLSIGELVKRIIRGTTSISKIATLMNKPTIRRAKQEQQQVTGGSSENLTTGAVVLRNVHYVYKNDTSRPREGVPALSLRVEQGQLVCWPRQPDAPIALAGITTLFKLMSKQLMPTSGSVDAPDCLRTVHIPLQPVLFDGTLMYNLAYANIKDGQHVDMGAVWEICRALGMSKHLIGNEDYDVGTNGERLTFSDKLCVSLVRAITYDVDLLLISSGLDVLGKDQAQSILQYLRSFVENRGDPSSHTLPWDLRPQKTIVYASKKPELYQDVCHAQVVLRHIHYAEEDEIVI